MGGGVKERSITSESGFIANVNSSGQLAVDAIINVGAVTVGVSGQVVNLAAGTVQGSFPTLYVNTSGEPLSGIPHKLVVAFSGDNVIAAISGQPVVAQISGQQIVAKISGETINIQGGVSVSGNVVIAKVSGESHIVTSGTVTISGQNVNITSGQVQVMSGSLVAKISGETITVGNASLTVAGTVSVTSGTGVRISGETVSIAGGVSVSGNAVTVSGSVVNVSGSAVRVSEESGRATAELKAYDFSGLSWRAIGIDVSGGSSLKIAGSFSASVSGQPVNTSGSTVYLVSGQNPIQLYAFDASGQVLRDLWVKESGSHVLRVDTVTTVDISGATISAGISGQTLYIVSGQNTIQLTSGYNIVKISGETILAKTSGDSHVVTSGQVQITSGVVTISGNVVSISGGAVKISGETIVTSVSGNVVSILSGIGVRVSGEVVNISGQVVSVSGGVVKVSGEVIRISEESGRASAELKAYDFSGLSWRAVGIDVSGGSSLKIAGSFSASVSGQPVNTSGSFVFVSGQPVNVSGSFVFVSGQPVNVSGSVVNVSGQVVSVSGGVAKISGETVTAKVSGETMRLSFLEVSGTFVNPYVTQSGKGISGIPHKLVVGFSGDAVSVSGNVIVTSVSGNVVNISGSIITISGNAVSVSGGVVKISGETVIAKVSGETINSTVVVSGNVAIASVDTVSGAAMLMADSTLSTFQAFQTLLITSASGGIQLNSGFSRVVSVRNIGVSGCVMFVGSSGTSRAPWVNSSQSGFGWKLEDGDAISIPIQHANLIRVVSLTSGQRISYALSNY